MNRRTRTVTLLVVLILFGGYYIFQNPDSLAALGLGSFVPPTVQLQDNSAALALDEEIKTNIRHYFEDVPLGPQENNLGHAMELDHSVGRPQIARGEYREAYRTYQKVLAISYRQGNLMGIGIALNMMADMAYRANNLDESLFTTLLAYKVATTMQNKEEMGVIELSFARRLKDRDPSRSAMWLLRAKESLKNSRYREDYVRAFPGLARSLRKLGKDEQASQILEEAWELAQPLGESPGQKWAKVEVASALANDLDRAGKHDRAIEVLRVAQALFPPEERSTEHYTNVSYMLARAHAGLGKRAEAGRLYRSAYANYEVARADAPGEEARARLDANQKGLVDDLVEHHIQSGDFAAALALLESNKARTLNDVYEDPSYRESQDQWREMERRHAREVADLLEGSESDDELLPVEGRDVLAKLITMNQKHENERRQLQTTLQLKDTIVMRSLSKKHVEKIRRELPPDVAVLSFFVRHERVDLFLVTQRGIKHLPLPADVGKYNRSIKQLRVALTNPDNDFYREPAQWLFKQILGPAVSTLPNSVRILVYSPDGLLSRIPLEALMDGERFLGERFAVYRIPSLRYADAIGSVKKPPVRHGIVCVDPDISGARLPFQQETGKALKKHYADRVTSFAGEECSESKLVAAINANTQPMFLHIGAHGNFYPNDAMESAIYLSPDEEDGRASPAWSARAMATVDMHHIDLVSLSSCESGLTDSVAPRDVFGIARALLYAGAKTIVAPLWAVHDESTGEYMQAFYEAYGRNVPAVLALQQAQGALIGTERFHHPFYWSAFVLTGAAR